MSAQHLHVQQVKRIGPMATGPPMHVQDGMHDGCADSGDLSGGKLKPQLNEQQLKALLTQGPAAQAKVRWCSCCTG